MNNVEGNKPVWLVNGQALPVSGQFVYQTQQLVDSERNANAQVVARRINRRQLKFESVTWSYLTSAQWREIRRMIENFDCNLTYWDDYEDKIVTRRFYFGDSSATPFEYDSKNHAVARPLSYINCQCNIIDMGY